MVDTLRVWVNELADDAVDLRLRSTAGWPATRSSLMIAGERRGVDQNSASWNPSLRWLRRLAVLRRAA